MGGARANSIHYLRDGETVARSCRYDDMDEAVRIAAAYLRHECGVRAGDHVMLLMGDPLLFMTGFLACQFIGAIPIGLSPNLNRHSTGDRLISVAGNSRAPVLLTETAKIGHAALGALQDRLDIAVHGIGDSFPTGYPAVERVDSTIAFVQYTSGSTREPKGAVVSRRSLLAQFDLLIRTFRFSPDSTFVNWLPLHHDMGLVSKMLLPYHLGASSVHMLPAAFVQRPVRWLRAIERFRGTVSSAPNFAYELCLKIPAEELTGLDLSSWRTAVCGAEVVRASSLNRFAERFAAAGLDATALCPAYGMAEATLMVSAHRSGGRLVPDRPAGDVDGHRARDLAALDGLAGCGEPQGGLDVRIVSPESRTECARGEIGEIWVAGPCVADGYLDQGRVDRTAFSHTLPSGGTVEYFATGDLGYFGRDGLYVLGRTESAITIAGQKHFFSDIEFTMQQLDPRFEPNSTAAFSVDGGRSVTVVQHMRSGPMSEADLSRLAVGLVASLQAAHPVPIADVVFTSRPLSRTSSGKLRRNHVRQLHEAGRLKGVSIKCQAGLSAGSAGDAADEVERRVLEIVGQMLGVPGDEIDQDCTLARLGAESLSIMRIQFELERQLGCVIDRAALYLSLSIREIVSTCRCSGAVRGEIASDVEPTQWRPKATQYQTAIHVAEALAQRPIYTLARAVRIGGPLRPEVLRLALLHLERRHEALRGSFQVDGSASLYCVSPRPEPNLIVRDLRQAGAAAMDAHLREWVERGIDVNGSRLYRVVVLQASDRESILLLQVHHGIADFWSLSIVWRDLLDLYDRLADGHPPAPIGEAATYREYCEEHQAYLRSARAKADLAFWRARAGSRCDVRLPLPSHGIDGYDAGVEFHEIPPELERDVRAAAASIGVTVSCVMQLALLVSLSRLTRQPCVRYGLALLNRATKYSGTVGMFANLVPMEFTLEAGDEIANTLSGLRLALAAALEHEASPIGNIGPDALSAGSTPGTYFDVVYAYFDLADDEVATRFGDIALERTGTRFRKAGLDISPVALERFHIHYPLQIQVLSHAGGLGMRIEYRKNLLDALLVSSLVSQFRFALSVIADQRCRRLGEALAMPPEMSALLRRWGRGEAGGPRISILARIMQVAASEPSRIALIEAGTDRSWSYRRLIEGAVEVCERIRHHRHGAPGSVVAVMQPRSPAGVVACLGVLLAGCTYLPIDPAAPADRREYMLHDSGASMIVASRAPAPDDIGLPIIDVDACMDGAGSWDGVASTDVPDQLPAYLIYTSGSTGRPKGVLSTHGVLDRRIGWMLEKLAFDSEDVFLQKTSWSFDVSLWEILAPLAVGAKAVVLESGQERFPEAVSSAILRYGVTVTHFVPSVMAHWLGTEGSQPSACALRACVCSGERLLPAHVRAFFETGTRSRLYNFYGPTEAGIDVTYAEVEAAAPTVTIGRPAPDCELAIVDAEGLPVPPGVVGELVIGGPQIGLGYVGKPALTASQFVPSPFGSEARCYRTGDFGRFDGTGAVIYMGRRDGQIKLAGYRIELAEIEHVLASLPGVEDAVVLLRAAGDAQRLCAFMRMEAGRGPTRQDAVRHARQRLPDFMMPHEWHLLTRFPLLDSGKVDKAALLAAADPAPENLPSRVEELNLLALHWRQVLGGATPSQEDDFFEAGGDSILALQYVGRLREAGIEISVQELFRHRTIAALRALSERRRCIVSADRPHAPVEPLALLREQDRGRLRTEEIEDAYPLSYFQKGILYKYFNDDHYEIFVTSLEIAGRWDHQAMSRAVGHVMKAHPFLRGRIDIERYSEPLQLIHRETPPPLIVHDLSGMPQAGRHAYLQSWLDAERRRAFAWDALPLCRYTVHLLDEGRFQLTFSEVSLDGWCVATVLTELLCAYSAFSGGTNQVPPAQSALSYREFVALEQQAVQSAEHRDFWRARLAEGRGSVPAGTAAVLPEAPHSRAVSRCGTETLVQLERVAKTAEVPLKSVLMAAHLGALFLVSGAPRQTSGVEFNGRPELPGGERCVGVFNNLLPFTLDLSGLSWHETMRACFEMECRYLPYRRFPYAELVRMNEGRPLFDILFVYTHFHVYRALGALDLDVVSHYASDQTYIPLTVHFNRSHARDELQILFDYDERRITAERVAMHQAALAAVLSAICTGDIYGAGAGTLRAARGWTDGDGNV